DRRAPRVQDLALAPTRPAAAAPRCRSPERAPARVERAAPRARLAGPADAQRLAHDPVLLVVVQRRVPLARARTPGGADVPAPLSLSSRGGRLVEPMTNRSPGAHVLRLLLRPHDLARVRVRRDHVRHELERERIELLDPGDCDRVGFGSEL